MIAQTCAEAYHQTLGLLLAGCAPLVEETLCVMRPTEDAMLPELAEETAQYVAAHRSGFRRAQDFAERCPSHDRCAYDDGEWIPAYGYLLWFRDSLGRTERAKHQRLAPFQFAVSQLKRDAGRPFAISTAPLRLPQHHLFRYPPPALTELTFSIRAGAIDLAATATEAAAIGQLEFELPLLANVQESMRSALRTHYPDLKTGRLYYHAHEIFLPNEKIEKARKIVDTAKNLT